MKKPTPKLTLQRETLRALIGLELRHAIGGDPAPLVADTGKEVCTAPVMVDTGTEICTAPLVKK